MPLIENLPESLRRIDISYNPNITIKSYRHLCQTLLEMRLRITHLSLDSNIIGDQVCQEICTMICSLKSLQVVNLSKCAITCMGALSVASLLTNRYLKIKTLLLHWNMIRGKGAVALAKAVRKSDFLQIFDSSFNSFGSSQLKKKRKGPKP